jgi:hypothetical protein
MRNYSNPLLVDLLIKINTNQIESFFHFPHIFRSGNIHLDKKEIDYLFNSGCLEQKTVDSFGPIFQLNEKARSLLIQLGMGTAQNATS